MGQTLEKLLGLGLHVSFCQLGLLGTRFLTHRQILCKKHTLSTRSSLQSFAFATWQAKSLTSLQGHKAKAKRVESAAVSTWVCLIKVVLYFWPYYIKGPFSCLFSIVASKQIQDYIILYPMKCYLVLLQRYVLFRFDSCWGTPPSKAQLPLVLQMFMSLGAETEKTLVPPEAPWFLRGWESVIVSA